MRVVFWVAILLIIKRYVKILFVHLRAVTERVRFKADIGSLFSEVPVLKIKQLCLDVIEELALHWVQILILRQLSLVFFGFISPKERWIVRNRSRAGINFPTILHLIWSTIKILLRQKRRVWNHSFVECFCNSQVNGCRNYRIVQIESRTLRHDVNVEWESNNGFVNNNVFKHVDVNKAENETRKDN